MPPVYTTHSLSLRTMRPLLLVTVLFVLYSPFAQSQQNRYLTFGTYTDASVPSTGDGEVLLAANSGGEVCVETDYYLVRINTDGSLGYSKLITDLKAIPDRGGLHALTIDDDGDCYLAGQGRVLATPGAYQSGKSFAMYVVKLDPQGNTAFATFVGGSGNDIPSGVALDGNRNIWLTGTTNSNDFPVSANAIQSSFQGGGNDAFIAELNSTGSQLLYGTYLGGSGSESIFYYYDGGITVDPNGNVYVTGTTESTNFPVLNALEPTLSAPWNSFITKLDISGTLLYSTYFGQTGETTSIGIAADAAGEAYITGEALNPTGFPQVNPILGEISGYFIAKLNSTGSGLVYSTFFGQGDGETVASPHADSQGDLLVVGGGLVDQVNPIQSDTTSYHLSELDPNGTLIFSSYLGTPAARNDTKSAALGMDSTGNAYIGYAAAETSPPLLKPIFGSYSPFHESGPAVAKLAVGTGISFSMPGTVQYPPGLVGNTQNAAMVTLFNTGTTDINISEIATNGDDFLFQGNQCPATLTAGTQCDLFVAFSPTGGGARNGTIVINDDSPGNPHIIQLTGVGLTPGVSINPTSLTFSAQGIDTTSPAQNVTLTNTGGASLSISHIGFIGTNPGDFAETNNCGTSLAAGTSCSISVVFTPTQLGPRTAVLSITDAVGNQTVDLTGTGAVSLGLSIPSGGTNSATVNAGSTAKYTLSIGGGGLSGTAILTCAGAPTGATCSLPDSLNVSDTNASDFTVTISTTAKSSAAMQRRSPTFTWFWAIAMLGLALLPGERRTRQFARRLAGITSLFLLTLLVSCGGGGGSSSGGGSGSGGTPAGTYTLTVTATMGTAQQSQSLKLTVN